MQVRIGVTNIPREIEVELADDADADSLRTSVEQLLASGAGMLWLTDRKGRQVGVPADKVAYIELGRPDADHRIGFGS